MGDWFAEKAAGIKAADKVEQQPTKCPLCCSDNLLYGRESGRASSKCRQCGSIQLWGPKTEREPQRVPTQLNEIREAAGGERGFLRGEPFPTDDLPTRIEAEVRRKFSEEQ